MDKEIEIRTYPVGPIDENCYLVWNRRTKEGFVIDPGDEQEHIWDAIKKFRIDSISFRNLRRECDYRVKLVRPEVFGLDPEDFEEDSELPDVH